MLNISSGSAKAALTMPIIFQFSESIGVSRQAKVMAFQFGDGFTNMITPTSGVLIGVLGVAKIPYDKWVKMDRRFYGYPSFIGTFITDSNGYHGVEWVLKAKINKGALVSPFFMIFTSTFLVTFVLSQFIININFPFRDRHNLRCYSSKIS
ncbi:AbgT family transporter [Labilibaculum antarcticum]|uniref:Short-chain fatty acid transporter n=1 Tax=Labilibaculum antarcticum TaxID=1717717 RepID=A0A1Y1CLX2_9BACT|nr:AbgT family transporter [Labilibaculum antarcticum]BAX80972.1 short-chain fatty acid transporter [Labilibaculum antarcticum]